MLIFISDVFEELTKQVQEKDSLASQLNVRHIAIEQLLKNCSKLPCLQMGRAAMKSNISIQLQQSLPFPALLILSHTVAYSSSILENSKHVCIAKRNGSYIQCSFLKEEDEEEEKCTGDQFGSGSHLISQNQLCSFQALMINTLV